MSAEKKDSDKVNEPQAAYRKTAIKIFHSFEEQKEYEMEQILKMEPIERIRKTVELILRMYGFSREDLNKRIPNNKIKVRYFE